MAGMKKQRPSQHGGKSPTSVAKPAIPQNKDDNEDFGSPMPSSFAASESTVRHLSSPVEKDAEVTESSSSTSCIVSSFDTPTNRSGQTVTPNADGTSDANESFEMKASFKGSYPGECRCCEYRQYVKGYFQVQKPGGNWKTVPLELRWGVMLDQNTYNEDGKGTLAYGLRDQPGIGDNYTPLPRTTGCSYSGSDAPGFKNLPKGVAFSAWLDFQGKIIDVCHENKVANTKEWTVHLNGVI